MNSKRKCLIESKSFLGKSNFQTRFIGLSGISDISFIEKGYFGLEDSSLDYIGKIVDFIYNKIGTYPHKITPENLSFQANIISFTNQMKEHLGTYSSILHLTKFS